MLVLLIYLFSISKLSISTTMCVCVVLGQGSRPLWLVSDTKNWSLVSWYTTYNSISLTYNTIQVPRLWDWEGKISSFHLKVFPLNHTRSFLFWQVPLTAWQLRTDTWNTFFCNKWFKGRLSTVYILWLCRQLSIINYRNENIK